MTPEVIWSAFPGLPHLGEEASDVIGHSGEGNRLGSRQRPLVGAVAATVPEHASQDEHAEVGQQRRDP